MNANRLGWLLALALAALPAAAGAREFSPLTRSDSMGVERRGDARGMRAYWLGFLARGPRASEPRTPHVDTLMSQHLANLGLMWEAGALVAAGPFLDGEDVRGVCVFVCDSAEAAARVAFDPAVREGRLRLELHPWYGPAGIGAEYRARHAANPKAPDSMTTLAFGFLERGPRWNRTPNAEERALQDAHLAHLGSLAASGKLRIAGPLADDGPLAGILVFDVPLEEARSLAASDPKVKYGWLTLRVRPWMCAHGTLPPRAP